MIIPFVWIPSHFGSCLAEAGSLFRPAYSEPAPDKEAAGGSSLDTPKRAAVKRMETLSLTGGLVSGSKTPGRRDIYCQMKKK
jgi:hypothetical protein